MSEAGIVMEDKAEELQEQDDNGVAEPPASEYSGNTLEELEEMLEQAITNEEYEKASSIRSLCHCSGTLSNS